MPVGIVLSLDYEIHGNGEGSPLELMVEPTWRLLRQVERFGAKLTIFAEAVEILRFRDHLITTGRDEFSYREIVEQLRYAACHGHDVQLHIHPSYLGAKLGSRGWEQDWSEYDTAQLSEPRAKAVIAQTKSILEDIIRPVQPTYEVYAFRAGNWAMMPTRNIAAALIEHGIRVDSSVFKGGKRDGIVSFDYTAAKSEVLPWRVDLDNVCREDRASPLWEYPIWCEMRRIASFLSVIRLYRVYMSLAHRVATKPASPPAGVRQPAAGRRPGTGMLAALFVRHPWKADFNQCSGNQLIRALKRASARYDRNGRLVPFVAIGHSKLFIPPNERNLERFFGFAKDRPNDFRFCLYRDFL